MIRVHFNQTSKPITFRTWILKQDTVEEDDFLWLKSFDIPIRVERDKHTVDLSNGQAGTYYGSATYTLETTTNKQRDMLVLKYGNNVVLIQEDTVLPNMMSHVVKDW